MRTSFSQTAPQTRWFATRARSGAAGFSCACMPGYAGNGARSNAGGTGCTDIDECALNANNCHADALCTNTPGSFTCACKPGHSGNGITCTDINECTAGTDNCDGSPEACVNTVGSFMCSCPGGYRGNGVGVSGCSDIDECAENIDTCDNTPNACKNTKRAACVPAAETVTCRSPSSAKPQVTDAGTGQRDAGASGEESSMVPAPFTLGGSGGGWGCAAHGPGTSRVPWLCQSL